MEYIDIEEQESAVKEKPENEINLVDIIKQLWSKRKLIGIWCGIGLILSLIVAFSIPKAYTSQVTLAPETSDSDAPRNMGTLAALAGINLGSSGSDAVYPDLYPNIVKSVPFTLDLLNIPLTDESGTRKFTLQEYLNKDMKAPWWGVILAVPGKLIGMLKSKSATNNVSVSDDGSGPIIITKEQFKLISQINSAVIVSVDSKTSIVTLTVTLQDPVVAAIVADSVTNRLKEYVTNYRTNKARQDLQYIQQLNDNARESYYKAQQRYANYLDTHQGIVLYSAQTMRDRLENEATLAFNIFNQTAQQLEMAKAKVQENTPVFATIEPATVPLTPSAPRKKIIILGFIFVAFVGAAAWILYIKPFKDKLKESDEENNKTNNNKEKIEAEIIISEE